MIHKKIIFWLLVSAFLSGCTSPTVMLGPAYTLTTSGNIYQAGLTYGSNEMITRQTGKTPIENIQELSVSKKNIQKQTLKSEDFYILVKNKMDKTRSILKKTNQ
tara:strand:+ start:295 stop:606 length:312 start_codon:yes stop_codon:yes gene_type:complete